MKKSTKLILITLITIVLELTIFNFRYIDLKLSNLQEKEIALSSENIISEKTEDGYYIKELEVDLNEQVKGIKLKINTKSNKNVIVETTFVDKSSKYEEKQLDDKIYNNSFKNSEYIVLNSKQECQKIKLTITSALKADVESITINTWYYEFNIIRVITILLIALIAINIRQINDFLEKRKNITYIILMGIIMRCVHYVCTAVPKNK